MGINNTKHISLCPYCQKVASQPAIKEMNIYLNWSWLKEDKLMSLNDFITLLRTYDVLCNKHAKKTTKWYIVQIS